MSGNRRFNDGTDQVRFDETRQIQPGEDILDRTRGHDGPFFDDDHVVGQLYNLVEIVADVENRNAQILIEPLKERQNFVFARHIQ